jgi:hypothetical protein
MYGKIVDARGNTIVADADADMAVPRGGKFIPAPMHYFMRFTGPTGCTPDTCQVILRRTAVSACLRKRDCVLQLGQRRNSGHCLWKNASRPLLGPVAIDFSGTKQSIRGSTIPPAVRAALCTSSAVVAVKA